MSDPVIDPDDLATYLGLPTIDSGRAALIIQMAQALCEAQPNCNPLPSGGAAVVLDVVVRAWSNPQNAQQQTTGPYSASYGAVSGGLWLTKQNKATLRSLVGEGSVFTIETMSATAGTLLPPWDQGYYSPNWSQ